MKNNKKVLVFGTFDLLHKGHLDFFKQARKHGNILIAVIARDKTVMMVKNRKPLHNEKKRLINAGKHVDKAVLGGLGNKYAVITAIKPEVICLGYDQNSFTKGLRSELKKRNIKAKVIRLKPYKSRVYKTTMIRKRL